MKPHFLALILILALVSCSKFDRADLLHSTFNADLVQISKGHDTKYSDGCFLVFDVSEFDSIYKRFFSKHFSEGNVSFDFLKVHFDSSEAGPIRYQVDPSVKDGCSKTIFYIPKKKILGFGYSTGFM